MKNKIFTLILGCTIFIQTPSFAMSTQAFDKGMKKGIDYFNKGLFYEAKDEFTWFKDYNYQNLNSGQQKYLNDYLDGTYNKINQWECTLQLQKIVGWWFFHNEDPYMEHHSENIQFGADGSFFSQTWRQQCYGTYEINSQNNTISATYDIYYCWAGQSTYTYGETAGSVFSLNGNILERIGMVSANGIYADNRKFVHKDSFTDVGIQH